MARARYPGGRDARSIEQRFQSLQREIENLKGQSGGKRRVSVQVGQSGVSGSLADHERAKNPHPQYSTYVHDQSSASASWSIEHNLGWYPSVTVVDSSGNVVEGAITYDDKNNVTVAFRGAFSGKAYLN